MRQAGRRRPEYSLEMFYLLAKILSVSSRLAKRHGHNRALHPDG
jgi:hypothetical protein